MPKSMPVSPLTDLQEQYRLLRLEYAYEKETYHQRAKSGDIEKKVQQGICWYPAHAGKTYYNSLNQQVIEIERDRDEEAEYNFEHGNPVCFFTLNENGALHFFHFTGTINYVQGRRMIVLLPDHAAISTLLYSTDIGVQLYFDETTFRLMFSALSATMEAKNNRLAALRDTLLGSLVPHYRNQPSLHLPWLNQQQEIAVNEVLRAQDMAIVHGPPGTGKTTTLVEAIYETLHRENQVMVCAPSNTAVDWIAEKLTDRGLHVLRVGNPTRVNDKMLSFTYERRFEAHPDYPELWNIRKAIRELRSPETKKKNNRTGNRNRLQELQERATTLEIKINRSLFDEARVIACTLTGSANRVLERKHFTTLFIDEASQALEAACWIAIGKAERVVFAGDHCQLPPTVKCPEAAQGGLAYSLMQKVSTRHPSTVSLLEIQYRMHEDIMAFPSRWFYHNRLKAAPEVRQRGILQYDIPLVWYDTSDCSSQEETVGESQSRINKTEARILLERLCIYTKKIGENRILNEHIDFGLISPYKAQVRYIRHLIRKEPAFKTFRSLISVNTVDGFQGQERDVILISLVRANEEGQIGFLNDLRRMNVAITRARMKLIILGNASTLVHRPFYRALYDYIAEKGLVVNLTSSLP